MCVECCCQTTGMSRTVHFRPSAVKGFFEIVSKELYKPRASEEMAAVAQFDTGTWQRDVA